MTNNTKNGSKEIVIIVVLVVVALILGYSIYSGQTPDSTNNTPQTTTQEQPTTNVVQQPASDDPDVLTVLNAPTPDASDEEKKSHYNTAIKIAQDGNSINIQDCLADPVVLRAKQFSEITINNTEDTDTEIAFNNEAIYSIPAMSSIALALDTDIFQHGPGLYGYGCNLIPSTAGLILVTD